MIDVLESNKALHLSSPRPAGELGGCLLCGSSHRVDTIGVNSWLRIPLQTGRRVRLIKRSSSPSGLEIWAVWQAGFDGFGGQVNRRTKGALPDHFLVVGYSQLKEVT